MPKAVVNRRHKTINLEYDGDLYQIEVWLRHTASDIRTLIYRTIGPSLRSEFFLHTGDKNMALLTWFGLDTRKDYIVEPKAASRRKPKALTAENKMEEILTAWELENASQILPPEIAPRFPMKNDCKATSHSSDIIKPELWTQRFITALWKVTMESRNAHEEAVGVMMEVVRNRQGDEDNNWRAVVEIMTSDLEKAWAVRKERASATTEAVSAVGTFTEGLRAGIEGVEEEMETDKFAGNLREEIKEISDRLDVEDGKAIARLRIADQ